MSTTIDKYTAQRAELLAKLVLTRRKGVQVFPYPDASDTGIDLLVHLPAEGRAGKLNPYLFAQVLGASDTLEDEQKAAAFARKHWKPLYAKGFLLAPIVFLLFSMEGDQGYFGWMLEPRIDRKKGPSLVWVESPEMTKITKKSTDGLLDAVETWFQATAEILLRDKSER